MQQLQKTTLTSLLAHYEPLVIAGLVFVAHLVLRAADRILVGAFNDDGAYVALGQALAGGVGYRLIYLVGDPVAVKYPPGLPLLIAVPWKLFGTLAGVRATIALLNPLASGAAAGIIWWIGRRGLDAAPAVLGLCALGPFFLDAVIQYFNIPLSEPYFVCGWATALLLTYRMADAGPGAARPALHATLGLGINGLGYMRYLSGYLAPSHVVGPTLAAALALAALAGGVRARRAHAALVVTVAAVLATVLLWPYAQGRLLLPILPFAGLLAASTLQLAIGGGSVTVRRFTYALLGFVALTVAVRQVELRRAAEAALASGAAPRAENRSPLYVLAGNSRYILGVGQGGRANTTPRDRIIADAPAAVDPYTPPKTAPAAPAEPAFAPFVFPVPGRYLATRILEDSLTGILLGLAGSRLAEDSRAVGSAGR